MLTFLRRGNVSASSNPDDRIALAAIVSADRIVDGSAAAGLVDAPPAERPRYPCGAVAPLALPKGNICRDGDGDSGWHLLVLSPADFIDLLRWNIASLRGIAYHELFGKITARSKVAGHNDFRVDPSASMP